MFTQYVLKSGWEIVAAPLTYRIVAFLKRAEKEDYYDIDTNFTPFSLKDLSSLDDVFGRRFATICHASGCPAPECRPVMAPDEAAGAAPIWRKDEELL